MKKFWYQASYDIENLEIAALKKDSSRLWNAYEDYIIIFFFITNMRTCYLNHFT